MEGGPRTRNDRQPVSLRQFVFASAFLAVLMVFATQRKWHLSLLANGLLCGVLVAMFFACVSELVVFPALYKAVFSGFIKPGSEKRAAFRVALVLFTLFCGSLLCGSVWVAHETARQKFTFALEWEWVGPAATRVVPARPIPARATGRRRTVGADPADQLPAVRRRRPPSRQSVRVLPLPAAAVPINDRCVLRASCGLLELGTGTSTDQPLRSTCGSSWCVSGPPNRVCGPATCPRRTFAVAIEWLSSSLLAHQ
jgi:hypothetical protein